MDINGIKTQLDISVKDASSHLDMLKEEGVKIVKEIQENDNGFKSLKADNIKVLAEQAAELSVISIKLVQDKEELKDISSKSSKIRSDIELLDLELDRKETQNKSIKEMSMDFDNRERAAKRLEERVLKDEAEFKIKTAGYDKRENELVEREKLVVSKDEEQEKRAIYLQDQWDNIRTKLPEGFDGDWAKMEITMK